MLTRFWASLGVAVSHRRRTTIPPLTRLIASVVALVALYLLLAIVVVPPDAKRHANFVNERGAVTVLSAVFLSMASGFAFLVFFLTAKEQTRQRFFWLVMCGAMGLLALDELLEFHERLGKLLDRRQASSGIVAQVFRHWNDLIVILYGVVALPISISFLPCLLRYPRVLELFCVAFGLYAVHTIIDATQSPATILSIILEESAKLYCSAFLALTFLVAALGCIASSESRRS